MAREAWAVDWQALRTPEIHFYATSLAPAQAGGEELTQMISGHWKIENQLHHVKDHA